jgi:hypothetical protein
MNQFLDPFSIPMRSLHDAQIIVVGGRGWPEPTIEQQRV